MSNEIDIMIECDEVNIGNACFSPPHRYGYVDANLVGISKCAIADIVNDHFTLGEFKEYFSDLIGECIDEC